MWPLQETAGHGMMKAEKIGGYAMAREADKETGCVGEISRRLNLSKSTVSKALNNCGGVDARTKERILRAAREVRYEPAVRRRREQRAGTAAVGVVLPINPYYFWSEAVRGMREEADEHGDIQLCLSLFANMESESDALYCLDYMEDLQTDLLVVTPPPFPSVTEKLRVIAAHTPVVYFNETAPVPSLFYAGANFYQDGIRLARACCETLCTHPGLLCVKSTQMPMVCQRDEAFFREIQSLVPEFRLAGEIRMEHGRQALLPSRLARILSGWQEEYRSVYVSQGILPQVCLALQKLGQAGRVAVFGYENPDGNEPYWRRGILSAVVCQDAYRQGRQCIQAVADWLKADTLPENRRVYVPSKLLCSGKGAGG